MHKPQGGQSQSICQPLEMHPEPFLRHHLLNLLLELQILLHHRYHLKVQHCSFWLIVCSFSAKFVPYRNFRKAGFFMLFSFRDVLFRGHIQCFYSSVWLNKSWHHERIAGSIFFCNFIFGVDSFPCVSCDVLLILGKCIMIIKDSCSDKLSSAKSGWTTWPGLWIF